MATTAPAVTSAVDSQSTPIRSHTGTRLAAGTGRRLGPGFQRRLGPAQRSRSDFDVGDIARQLVAHGLRHGAGVFGNFA